MLVLTRRFSETIVIDGSKYGISEPIKITVVMNNSDRVRLGVEAPNDMPVHRLEIYEKIQRRRAAGLSS